MALRVVTAHRPPLMSISNTTDGTKVFTGLLADLLPQLLQQAGIRDRYDFYDNTQGGGRSGKDGNWTGVMGELTSRRADMAMFPLTLTAARAQAMDHTTPYLDQGYALLVKQTQVTLPASAFLLPFHLNTWLLILAALVFVIVLLSLLDGVTRRARMAALERANGLHHQGSPGQKKERMMQYALESVMMGMGQGGPPLAKSWSVKLLFITWAMFSVIMLSSYTANLTAHLTVAQLAADVSSLKDLAVQHLFFGVPQDSSVQDYFASSQDSAARALWSQALTYSDTDLAIADVRGGKLGAYITDWPLINYAAQQPPCDLTVGTDTFGPGALVIGLPPNSSLTSALNTALLQLTEDGSMSNLKRKWFLDASACSDSGGSSSSNSNSLGLSQVYGIFILLGVGAMLSVLYAVGETLFYRFGYHSARKLRASLSSNISNNRVLMHFSTGNARHMGERLGSFGAPSLAAKDRSASFAGRSSPFASRLSHVRELDDTGGGKDVQDLEMGQGHQRTDAQRNVDAQHQETWPQKPTNGRRHLATDAQPLPRSSSNISTLSGVLNGGGVSGMLAGRDMEGGSVDGGMHGREFGGGSASSVHGRGLGGAGGGGDGDRGM